MIFSELYSAYYNAVAGILREAVTGEITEKEMRRQIAGNAFSESALTILPALKEEKWQLIDREGDTPIRKAPTLPLTTLEKQWLKAISLDPRIRLFDVRIELEDDIEPLFTPEDYRVFDKYGDGDPFEDETYIAHFRRILEAIREKKPLLVTMRNGRGKEVRIRFQPVGIEYSEKDDKFRVIATGCRYRNFNIGRLLTCEYAPVSGPWREQPPKDEIREVVLEMGDERNVLERVMLHFAHLEKQAEKLGDGRFRVKIKYYAGDETEILIRLLSFGPYVKVVEPESFVALLRERLIRQKSCGLK